MKENDEARIFGNASDLSERCCYWNRCRYCCCCYCRRGSESGGFWRQPPPLAAEIGCGRALEREAGGQAGRKARGEPATGQGRL